MSETFETWYGPQPQRVKGQLGLEDLTPESPNVGTRAWSVEEVVRLYLHTTTKEDRSVRKPPTEERG